MSTFPFIPTGQSLITSAFTPDTIGQVFQTLAAQMLGFNPATPTDPAYTSVRLDWPTDGQPAWAITDNVCFIRPTVTNTEVARYRDSSKSTNDSESIISTTQYTRVWEIQFTAYGPNCFLNLSAIKSFLLLDTTHDLLAVQNLYLVADIEEPIYAPELFTSQWWKRADLKTRFNEFVTETIVVPTIASVEIKVYDASGLVRDFTVNS